MIHKHPFRASTAAELHEEGFPRDSTLVAWESPWTYYRVIPAKASPAHPTERPGAIVGYDLVRMKVSTNHPMGEPGYGIQWAARTGLHEPPSDISELRAVVKQYGDNVDDLAAELLTPTRPESPPIK